MWIYYGWSLWVGHGLGSSGGGLWMSGGLSGFGYRVAGSLDTLEVLHRGQWERVIACIFLHGGLLHILMNSAAILQLGRVLEMFTTAGRCWLTLLISGVCGSLATLVWSLITKEPGNAIGASGAACGLGTALIVLNHGVKSGPLAEFRKQMIVWVVLVLALGFAPMISGSGHAGGAIGGVIAGLLIKRRGSVRLEIDSYSRFLSLLTALLTFVYIAALAINTVRAPERRELFVNALELRGAFEEVATWVHEQKVRSDRIQGLDLSPGYARIRDDLLAIVRKNDLTQPGKMSPEKAAKVEQELEELLER
jgi:membrane associated rhomboid family serine protease